MLLLFDGYDEYKPRTNQDIDEAIESTIGDCLLVLTSRPENIDEDLTDRMNSVITIEGFDESSINECGTMFLGNDLKRREMLEQAKNVGIYDLLNVPTVMLMVCTVFFEKKSLPKTRTEIVGTIFRLAMDRSTLKTFGKRSEEVRELDNLLYILGEISWSCLQKDVQQLLIFKESIQFALLSSLKEYLKYFQRDFFGNSFDFFMKQDDVEEHIEVRASL